MLVSVLLLVSLFAMVILIFFNSSLKHKLESKEEYPKVMLLRM